MHLKILSMVQSALSYFVGEKKKADFCSHLALIQYHRVARVTRVNSMHACKALNSHHKNSKQYSPFFLFAVALKPYATLKCY